MRLLSRLIKRYLLRYYQNLQLKKSNFPSEVWIENTNHCNAVCIMCPREKHVRNKGIMEFHLFSKIINEISNYKDQVKRVHMHNFGEPLLDKRLPERVRLAKDLGIKHVYFVTNASLLNKKNSKALIESGLDEMKISFYGINEKSYNSVMAGLDFNTTLNNVKQFFEIRKEMNAKKPRIVLQFIPQVLNDLKAKNKWINIFQEFIDEEIGDSFSFSQLYNFGDGKEYIDVKNKHIVNVCSSPWRVMVILQDGSVAPCCFDYNGEIKIGNLYKSTIYKIWNNKKYEKIRKDFKQLSYDEYPICKKCDVPIN